MTQQQYTLFNAANYLFIDMDGTLVDTDKANNAAYLKAIKNVTGLSLGNKNTRITSSMVKANFSKSEANEIIRQKEIVYTDYLNLTSVNSELVNILLKSGKKCFVVSHSKQKRGEDVLKYHLLYPLMDKCLFYNSDKFNKAINELGVNPKNIFVFENEEEQKQNAIKAGCLADSIYLY